MPLPTDWAKDPVVLLEKRILPVLHLVPEWALAWVIAKDGATPPLPLEAMAIAHETLMDAGDDLFSPAGIYLEEADVAACQTCAATLCEARSLMKDIAAGGNTEGVGDLAALLATRLRPEIDGVIDIFRRCFIGTVLLRQKNHAEANEIAIKQLSTISRKIFFVSVNASVEAARAGDMGRGMGLVSGEVRSLSKEAEDATKRLLDRLQVD